MPTDMHQLPRAKEFCRRETSALSPPARAVQGRAWYEELYALSCLGLVKACDGFDTGRGVCALHLCRAGHLGEIKKLFRDGGTVRSAVR